MTINNNLNAMVASELQFQDMATNLATVANTVAEPEFQEVTSDLTNLKDNFFRKNLGLTDLRSLTLRIAASALPLEMSMPT